MKKRHLKQMLGIFLNLNFTHWTCFLIHLAKVYMLVTQKDILQQILSLV